MTDTVYSEMVSYAGRILIDTVSIDARDVVNDVLLTHLENSLSIEYDFVKPVLRNAAIATKYHILNNTWRPKEVEKVCCKCRLLLPVSCFATIKRKAVNQLMTDTICVECKKKENKKSSVNYMARNREKWNSYLKERYKKDSENLTNAFCIKMLRNKYDREFIDRNPHLIAEYRAKAIEKRAKKNYAKT